MSNDATTVVTRKVIINNEQGLHARPAALFVQKANTFTSVVTVTKDDQVVDGKSIMGIMMLAAAKGSCVIIEAKGEDAELAVNELEKIVRHEE